MLDFNRCVQARNVLCLRQLNSKAYTDLGPERDLKPRSKLVLDKAMWCMESLRYFMLMPSSQPDPCRFPLVSTATLRHWRMVLAAYLVPWSVDSRGQIDVR